MSFLTPRKGEVYNLGGGKNNSCSILESFQMVEQITGKKQAYSYVDENRIGDHICYYSDLRKIDSHFPNWALSQAAACHLLRNRLSWMNRLATAV